MIRIAVGGASGKLGSMVCDLIMESDDLQLVSAIVSPENPHLGEELFPGVPLTGSDRLKEALKDADVYVDLTTPTAASGYLHKVPAEGVNVVVGTTGIPRKIIDEFTNQVKIHGVSAVISPNFAIGVNVFWKLCEIVAPVLKNYDIEILEIHHNMKRDAPSGTAARAAEIISQATGIDEITYGRYGNIGPRGREIGVHALRAGDVIGEHTVIFAGNRERLEITHRAHSRGVFAEGCLAAVRWVAPRKDGEIHTMAEVLGL